MSRFFICMIVGFLCLSVSFSAQAQQSDSLTPTILITHVQAGKIGAATQEFIALFNNTDEEMDMTDWCLSNKNNVSFVCFRDEVQPVRFIVPAYSSALVASQPYVAAQTDSFSVSYIYTSTNQSSGSLVGSSDTIRLLDQRGQERDRVAWASSWPTGTTMVRSRDQVDPRLYVATGDDQWRYVATYELPLDQIIYRQYPPAEEEGVVDDVDDVCVPDGTCHEPLMLTEILPNAIGSDDGAEFIELFNTSDSPISLDSYSLKVGVTTTKKVTFSDGIILEPQAYRVFYNNELTFSLTNTTGQVQLFRDAALVDETSTYVDAKDNDAWALIDGVWQYTNQPTPGLPNMADLEEMTPIPIPAVLKPCATNQYRHPDTNRCRTIVQPATAAVCQDGYYRNAETNRCRKIVTSTQPAPCKAGQERNVETGRCRTIKQLANADYSSLKTKTEERQDQWYIVWAVVGITGALLVYGAWEWKSEIRRLLKRWRALVVWRK